MKTYLITGGGSGGHIYPALAVADEIVRNDLESRIVLVGARRGMERELFSKTRYKAHFLPVGQLHSSVGRLTQIKSLLLLPWCLFVSLFLILRYRPKSVLGVGGYASGPLCMISSLLGVPTFVWEANATPGVTNRILGKFRVTPLLVFKEAAQFFKKNEPVMTGLPIRREIEQKHDVEHKEAGVFSERPLSVLFVGGSQGAKIFNETLPEFVEKHGDKLNKFKIIHQTGLKNYESVLKAYKKKKIESSSVEVLAYLDPIKDYYDQADLVVCRSGASTVVELSVMGKPALFVPFPKASDDHQKSNAMSLVSRGAALLLEEKNFSSDTLVEILLSLKENPDSLVDLKQASQSIFPLGAREKIAKIVMGFRLE